MATRGHLRLLYSVVTEKRRNFNQSEIADSLKGTFGPNDPAQATNVRPVDVLAGEWLSLDSSGSIIRGGATQSNLAWPAFIDGDRFDVQVGGMTVIQGNFVAQSSMFDPAQSYSVGDELVVKQVTIDGSTRGVLSSLTASGDVVVAIVEKPIITDPAFPDGLLEWSTNNTGYKIP